MKLNTRLKVFQVFKSKLRDLARALKCQKSEALLEIRQFIEQVQLECRSLI